MIAAVPLLAGIHLVGWLRLPMPAPASASRGGGAFAALLAGLLLSLVVGSCGTPVLAAILAYTAHRANLLFGAALLFSYGLGSGLPFLLVGTGTGEIVKRLASGSRQRWTEQGAGVLLLALGFYLLLTTP